MADIVLSGPVRDSLLSLQRATDFLGNQTRPATGKAVTSTFDNPNSVVTAQSLSGRASDLSSLLDQIGQAIQTIKAAEQGVAAITKLVEAARTKANEAQQSSDSAARNGYGADYNALLAQMQDVATASGFNGRNLLAGEGNELTVYFNEDSTNYLTIGAIDHTDVATSLGLAMLDADATGAAVSSWQTDEGIAATLDALDEAMNTLRSQASTLGTSLAVVQNRQAFTEAFIGTLTTGADRLTLADTGEEGANLLALQIRQQLSSTALSLASQADQGVLRLFQ